VWVAVPVLSAVGALVFPMLQAVIVDDTTTFAGVGTTRVAFPSSGATILTSNGDQTFVLWGMADPARPRRLATFSGDARYSPDGHLLASRDTLWSLDGAARPIRLGRFTEGVPAAFSADGRMLLVHDRNATTLWNIVDPRRPVRLASLGRATSDATFAPDGRTLYTGDVDGNTITRWDLRDPAAPVPVAVLDGWQAVMSPDGGTLVV
jgi:WD40 repeat protein